LQQLLGKAGIEGRTATTARAAEAADACAHGSKTRKAGTALRGSVRTAVMRCHHLYILGPATAVPLLVLNPEIRKLHVSVVHRQVMDVGPMLDFVAVAIRASVAVSTSSIRLLEEALIVALQLLIQAHTANASTAVRQAISGAKIGLVQTRVVRQFARLGNPCVKRLDRLPIPRSACFFEDSATALRERNQSRPRLSHHVRHRANESGLPEVSQVSGPGIRWAIAVVSKVRRRHHAKRADSRQCANF
jgi:hypothetical protein